MIGQLRGQLLIKKPNLILMEVQGVGYEVHIPLTSFYELPDAGSEIVLQIHTHVREDAITLFGFRTPHEKRLFRKLISVGGIGPKLGVAILSGAKVEELAKSIADADLTRLTSIPGVGRKTAERVVLELKGQMGRFLAPDEIGETRDVATSDGLQEDILSALVNLGYPKASAEKTLARVLQSGECDRSFEDVLKHTLRSLAK